MDDADVRSRLERYVEQLQAAGAIRSPSIKRAFLTVERHRLVETFYHWTAGSQGTTPVHHHPERPVVPDLELPRGGGLL